MNNQNPNYRQGIETVFANSHFTRHVGFTLVDCGPGWCESQLTAATQHKQHSGVIHAGVLATMADQTAGAAAFSLAPENVNVLTVEFKINLLRPSAAANVRCRATVLKPGRQLTIVESEIFNGDEGSEKLVAKATVTIMSVPVS